MSNRTEIRSKEKGIAGINQSAKENMQQVRLPNGDLFDLKNTKFLVRNSYESSKPDLRQSFTMSENTKNEPFMN